MILIDKTEMKISGGPNVLSSELSAIIHYVIQAITKEVGKSYDEVATRIYEGSQLYKIIEEGADIKEAMMTLGFDKIVVSDPNSEEDKEYKV